MVLIIGIGNTLVGDDAVGLEAARRLADQPLPGGVRVLALESPGLHLIDCLAGAERAILLDAVVGSGPPGTVSRLTVDDLEVRLGALSAHNLGAAEALHLARLAEPEHLPKEIVIFGIEPKVMSPGLELSAEVAAVVPKVVGLVLEECHKEIELPTP